MAQMRYMLALDPGGTTGYCRASYNGDKLTLTPGQERFTERELYDFIRSEIPAEEEGDFYLIYEKFHYRNRARPGLDLTPTRLIGVIELICQTEGFNYFPQMPSEGMGYWTDDQLKRFSVYVKGLQHGRDAMRHLLQWWQFKYGFQFHKITPFTNYEVK